MQEVVAEAAARREEFHYAATALRGLRVIHALVQEFHWTTSALRGLGVIVQAVAQELLAQTASLMMNAAKMIKLKKAERELLKREVQLLQQGELVQIHKQLLEKCISILRSAA
ncbi:Aste57867_20711 [Aphanomyces stellatus]|uniref:Aste57867_20711 protein n=1 Tax=Aphanomyces stellatus TaxID=120398 RepID=A0A485LH28_9STRA|nr:hypothetical protein As57867_020643 [Aphanomyces stellatus]VFT97391.1 Aste57867_20711 [Aphanomyces stellatus]